MFVLVLLVAHGVLVVCLVVRCLLFGFVRCLLYVVFFCVACWSLFMVCCLLFVVVVWVFIVG